MNATDRKLRWPGNSQRESLRFAQIDLQKNPYSGKRNSYTSTGSPARKCLWGSVRMILLVFPGNSYGPGGPEINDKKPSDPAGTGTKNLLGGAEMTIILSDNNSRIFTASLIRPPGGWRGGKLPKIIVTVFPGKKTTTIKMRFSKMLFFLCFNPTIKFQDGSPGRPSFRTPCRPPLWTRPLKNYFYIVISAFLIYFQVLCIMFEQFARIASNLRFTLFSGPQTRFTEKGVQFGNPQAIRQNNPNFVRTVVRSI